MFIPSGDVALPPFWFGLVFLEDRMKYASLLSVFSTLIFMAPAQGASIVTNGSFSTGSGSFSGWSCIIATCTNALLNVDPYWTHVTNAPAKDFTYWAHLGDWNSSVPTYIDQNVSLNKGAGYTLTFYYGQYFDWNSYTSTDFAESNNITATLGGTTEYTASNFIIPGSSLTSGTYLIETAVTVGYTAPGTGGGSESENLKFSAYDTLQDVILSGISITSGLPPAGVQQAVTTEYFDGEQVNNTPEPATFGFMAASCGLLFLVRKRARSAFSAAK